MLNAIRNFVDIVGVPGLIIILVAAIALTGTIVYLEYSTNKIQENYSIAAEKWNEAAESWSNASEKCGNASDTWKVAEMYRKAEQEYIKAREACSLQSEDWGRIYNEHKEKGDSLYQVAQSLDQELNLNEG